MTAIASPNGRQPVAPEPPQKPMPQGKGSGRGSCLGELSCFGGSPVPDTDAGRPDNRGRPTATWLTWSRFRKKKKTVPVDASATEPLPEKIIVSGNVVVQQRPQAGEGEAQEAGEGGHAGKREEATGEQPRRGLGPSKTRAAAAAVPSQGFFWRLRKSNKESAHSKLQKLESHQNRVSASLEKQHRRKQLPRLPFISPKYGAGRRATVVPPPSVSRRLRGSQAPATTARRSGPSTSIPPSSPARANPPPGASRLGGARPHKKSEERPPAMPCPSNVGRNDQVVGLSVLAVVLVVMLLFGRVSAIVLTCAWFYILPRLRGAAASEASGGGGGESAAEVDYFDSEEYKKRVVLEGLLQRDGRRKSGFG